MENFRLNFIVDGEKLVNTIIQNSFKSDLCRNSSQPLGTFSATTRSNYEHRLTATSASNSKSMFKFYLKKTINTLDQFQTIDKVNCHYKAHRKKWWPVLGLWLVRKNLNNFCTLGNS